MALVSKEFTVNVTPGNIPPTIHVSEYDVGRNYTVTLQDENGNTFTIPSGATASIEGTLNKKYGFTASASISNNKVTFALTESMTAYAGYAWCKIKLTQNSQPIQTCAFILAVDRAGVEADTILGGSGFQEQINEGIAEYFDNDPPFFELPSGGQSGQALLSDGADGAYWGTVQGGGGSGGGTVLPVSPYLGKKIGFLGDSNTRPNSNHTNKKYDVWVQELTGCTRLNYGMDGTGFAENGSSYDGNTFAKRVSGIDSECETVCVLGGINDVMRSTLGQFGDTSANTVYGGLEILCINLKSRFPTADIVFITPPSATGLSGYNAYQVANAIKEVANQRGVHVFDFRQWINNPDFNDIHYTSAGHEILGKALADYLVKLKHYAGYRYIRTDEGDDDTVHVTGVSLNVSSGTVEKDNTITLTATVTPVNATIKNVIWSTSDATKATVNNGVVTGVAEGTATITVKTVDGEFTASATITVTDSSSHDGKQVVEDFSAINYDFSQVTKYGGAWMNGSFGSGYARQFTATGYMGLTAGSYTFHSKGQIAANVFDRNFAYVKQLNGNNNAFSDVSFTLETDSYVCFNLKNDGDASLWDQVSLTKNS